MGYASAFAEVHVPINLGPGKYESRCLVMYLML